ncbi:hypothetical protein SAMN04488085_109173 [Geodermatophilus ruber]|uniref:Uncharacterized protein n=1 Tax=Geodermatophilus ruber TaxID=504800 RepID=A0A1I4GTM1_9ACTN|nr:hypothetical protein SAMN04488085_109173 [Geodermatophilus ruber]
MSQILLTLLTEAVGAALVALLVAGIRRVLGVPTA